MELFEFSAMNSQIVLVAEGDKEKVARGFQAARDYIVQREAQFTRFKETSELAALNRAAGSWFNATPDMLDLMQEAYELHLETDGLFHPAVLPALERAGYDKSMELVRDQVLPERAGYALARSETFRPADFRQVSFAPEQGALWMPAGMRIDLGGIAKGWIAERAAYVLSEYAAACAVNAGGDLFTVGLPAGAHAWQVEIEDPYDAAETIAVLNAPEGAVATSSVTKRKWKQGTRQQHHLIDPRTGLPAGTDWLSVTVIASHATTAEVFAKALLIAGSKQAGEISAAHGGIHFLAVDRDKKLWGPQEVKELLYGTGE